MRDKIKKILSITLGAACVFTTFAACKDYAFLGDDLGAGYDATAAVESNGGFAVKKGDYVYFINGYETYAANNEYGNVVKGALMRIPEADLKAGKTENIKTVVPSLFVSQNYDAGIYIYGNYVYYATPTTDKNMDGEVEYTYIDFKRAPLDGSAAPDGGHFARLSDNAATYRFVQESDGTVYCLYEVTEDSVLKLKSYNVSTGKTTTLVSGASDFFYDADDAESGDVYYTMAVNYLADSDNPLTTETYNQIYKVNASATATTDKDNASYTVYDGDKAVHTYQFDKAFLESKNAEAKDNKEDEPYNLGDYTTYPYVNLGTLVLDGIGKNTDLTEIGDERFNWNAVKTDRLEQDGYTYAINGYRNGGLYFTRTAIMKTGSPGTDTKTYYLADSKLDANWDSVKGNDGASFETVALNTTNTSSALFVREQADTSVQHYYMYANGASMIKEYVSGNQTKSVEIAKLEGDSQTLTPWKVDGDYLYFFSGTGNALSRVNWTGDEDDYNRWLADEEAYQDYQTVTLPCVNAASTTWYKPEFFGDSLLYSGTQTFGSGSNAYNYIYTTKLGTTADIAARVEKYEAVEEYIEEYSSEPELYNAMKYYFRTGETALYEAVKDEYDEDDTKKFDEFVAKFKEGEEFDGVSESKYITLIGKMTEADKESIKNDWKNSLVIPESETENEEDKGLPTWAIWLIVCGGVVVVAAAVIVPLVIVSNKKKAKAKEAEATVNAYKRKRIDTTDDLTIDVYADEEETSTQKERAEEAIEVTETAEETVEEVTTEEVAEQPVEQAENNQSEEE